MADVEVKLQAISAESFAAFGSLIDSSMKNADFSSDVFSYWDALNEVKVDGHVSFGMVESYPGPMVAVNLERHTRTSETLVPVDSDIVLVVGKPTNGDTADLEEVGAFRISQGQAVTLNPGVWHYVPLTGEQKGRTMVVFRLGTPDEDLLVDDVKETRGRVIRVVS